VRAFEDTMASWERDGLTRPAAEATAGPGVATWRFRLRESWALAGRILQGQKRVLTEEAREARVRARQELWRENVGPMTETDVPELDAARAAAMAWAYDYSRRSRLRQTAERPRRQAAVLAAVSGLASVAVLGWWVGWELAWIVIGVLLLHELGHLAAMEAFGYRERRVLFIPFFGAAALGDGEDATPSQRTLVYLLGPAPGILLGLASLYAYLQSGELWWLAAATTALLVNYLNLLPISPLDGGRVVETLLLGRYPRAQVAFLGTGALLFGIGAWALRDPILAGISLVLLTSLKGAWTAAGLLLRARERLPERSSEGQRIREVFTLLQEPPYASSPAAQRLRWAELVIPRLAHAPAGPRAAVLGGLVYLTMLVGVPVAVTGSIMVFEPALWATLTEEEAPAQTPGTLVRYEDEAPTPPPSDEDAAEAPDASPSRSAISEASVVGR
jgi:Zn-dependent protease